MTLPTLPTSRLPLSNQRAFFYLCELQKKTFIVAVYFLSAGLAIFLMTRNVSVVRTNNFINSAIVLLMRSMTKHINWNIIEEQNKLKRIG